MKGKLLFPRRYNQTVFSVRLNLLSEKTEFEVKRDSSVGSSASGASAHGTVGSFECEVSVEDDGPLVSLKRPTIQKHRTVGCVRGVVGLW